MLKLSSLHCSSRKSRASSFNVGYFVCKMVAAHRLQEEVIGYLNKMPNRCDIFRRSKEISSFWLDSKLKWRFCFIAYNLCTFSVAPVFSNLTFIIESWFLALEPWYGLFEFWFWRFINYDKLITFEMIADITELLDWIERISRILKIYIIS